MIKINSKNGITLIALVVTIVVSLIIAAISIVAGTSSIDHSAELQQLSQMKIVQHAIHERYTQQQEDFNKNYYVGDKCTENGTVNAEGEYYLLDADDLIDLGISMSTGKDNVDSIFIVNYETGYVKMLNSDNDPILGYNKGTDETTSYKIEITH